MLDMDEWDWHRVLDVNLTGAFLATQSVGRVMRAQGSGVIINIITAGEPQDRNKGAYITSMHGLVGLTRSASNELAAYGIHVHAVGSGLEEFQQRDKAVPSGLIEAVCFLCGSSLSGQIVNVEDK